MSSFYTRDRDKATSTNIASTRSAHGTKSLLSPQTRRRLNAATIESTDVTMMSSSSEVTHRTLFASSSDADSRLQSSANHAAVTSPSVACSEEVQFYRNQVEALKSLCFEYQGVISILNKKLLSNSSSSPAGGGAAKASTVAAAREDPPPRAFHRQSWVEWESEGTQLLTSTMDDVANLCHTKAMLAQDAMQTMQSHSLKQARAQLVEVRDSCLALASELDGWTPLQEW